MRVAVALAVALPLAAADLVWKAVAQTPPWAYHVRSPLWLALSVLVLGGVLLVTRIPSRGLPSAAGLLAGGVLGNALSAAWSDLAVANPIVVGRDDLVIAFNLADVCVLAGIGALTAGLAVTAIRQRERLRQTHP